IEVPLFSPGRDAVRIQASTTNGESPVKKKLLALGLVVAAGIYLLAGCSADRQTGARLGHVSVRLTDAPGDFDRGTRAAPEVPPTWGGAPDALWDTLKLDPPTPFAFPHPKGGVLARPAEGDAPAGHYTQVRLHLADGSNVVVNGTTYPLKV